MAHLQDARSADDLDLAFHARPRPAAAQHHVALERELDPDQQLSHRGLLGDEVVGPELQALVARLVVVPAGEEQERCLADE